MYINDVITFFHFRSMHGHPSSLPSMYINTDYFFHCRSTHGYPSSLPSMYINTVIIFPLQIFAWISIICVLNVQMYINNVVIFFTDLFTDINYLRLQCISITLLFFPLQIYTWISIIFASNVYQYSDYFFHCRSTHGYPSSSSSCPSSRFVPRRIPRSVFLGQMT